MMAGASENSMVQILKDSLRSDVKVVTNPIVNDMDNTVGEIIEGKLTEVKDYQLGKALNEINLYFEDKTNTILVSPEVKTAINEITAESNKVIAEEKLRIDQAIADYMNK